MAQQDLADEDLLVQRAARHEHVGRQRARGPFGKRQRRECNQRGQTHARASAE
jgi:hypothetical protein